MDSVWALVVKLFLWIDSFIYRVISFVYDIFEALAKVNLFGSNQYQDIVQRIYLILGLVMMFILAYSLLQAVINPDNFAKGENSFGKIAMNVVVSLVIIVILPTVFSLAYDIQNSLLDYHVVEKIIMGENYDENTSADDAFQGNAGREVAYNVFIAFLHPDEEYCESIGASITDGADGDINLSSCAAKIEADSGLLSWFNNTETLQESTSAFRSGTKSFSVFSNYSQAVAKGYMSYIPLLSTAAAVFVLYVFASFCFDVAIRIFKLMYFQIIAPIPVVCRILPGGKMKDVFNDWVRKTISTYLEIFIRLFTVYLGLYMIDILLENDIFSVFASSGLGVPQKLLAYALLIMGIIAFMRQVPKLISEMFHLDGGSMKLGIMDKLAAGGGLVAGAAIGGGLVSAGRNLVSGVGNTKDAVTEARKRGEKGVVAGFKGGVGTLTSTLAGGTSAAARGGRGALGAKNSKDMFAALNKGADDATEKRTTRAAYKANHANKAVNIAGRDINIPFSGVALGHLGDARDSVGNYFGFSSSNEKTIETGKKYDGLASSMSSSAKALRDKHRTDRALVNDHMDVDDWYGDTIELRQAQQDIYNELNMGTGGTGTLADLDNYAKQLSQPIDRNAFITKTRDAYNNVVETFDEASYNTKLAENRLKLSAVNQMIAKMDKESESILINYSVDEEVLNGTKKVGTIKMEDFTELNARVVRNINEITLDGNSVTDEATHKTHTFDKNNANVAGQLKDMNDAYAHNAAIASRELEKKKSSGGPSGGGS